MCSTVRLKIYVIPKKHSEVNVSKLKKKICDKCFLLLLVVNCC